MLVAGGNASPTAADITAVLSEVGVEVDSERLTSLLAEMEGKDVSELIASGSTKLVKMGGGGGGGGGGAAAAAGGDAAPAEAEKPKEEEVDALEGGMDMFGGGGGDY